MTSCPAQANARPVQESLRLYEAVRTPRASRVQSLSEANKLRFHLPDGPAQRERDEQMISGGTDFSFKAVDWIYAHDASVIVEPTDAVATA